MELNCKVITHGSAEQLESIELRREILRRPLGLDFTEKDLADEDKQIHIACFADKKLVGILLLVKRSPIAMKMRQVAVDANMQRQGVGKAMVQFAERLTLDNEIGLMILHARNTAVPFYLGLDYEIVSDEFLEVGIPHFEMAKKLY